jgi:transposase
MEPTAPRAIVSGEQRLVIVLMAAAGESNSEIGRHLAVSRPTVIMWRVRFAARGPATLTEVRPGRGPKRTICAAKVNIALA